MKTKKKAAKYKTKVMVPETDMDKEVREMEAVIERLRRAVESINNPKEDREEEVG